MGKKANLDFVEVIEFYKTHSIARTAKQFHTSDIRIKEILIQNNIEIHNPMDSRKLTYQSDYGVNNISQTKQWKEKNSITWQSKDQNELSEIVNKRECTKFNIYRDPKYNNPQKISKSLLNRNEEQLNHFRESKENTCLKFYGVRHYSQTETFSNDFKKTWENKDDYSKIERANKIRTSYVNTCVERYGVPGYCFTDEFKKSINSVAKDSKPNLEFKQLLELNGFTIDEKENREFPLNRYFYDFKINNLLIEINPTYTHNSTWTPYGDHKGLDPMYHFNKVKNANDNGYECICVWDWDDYQEVINKIKNGFKIIKRAIKKIEIELDHQILEIFDDGQDII